MSVSAIATWPSLKIIKDQKFHVYGKSGSTALYGQTNQGLCKPCLKS